ncbi:DoxX family protein [Nocardia sp. NPDC052112]|uniref:DoxX family protein n=1 Tax=Nocardia sp. NPDC052112 TaxID=3155646 RepID=UPI003426C894
MSDFAEVSRVGRYRGIGYWVVTVLVVVESGVGGLWDIARVQFVRGLIVDLGYPTYFLVLLGIWKLLGAVALLAPGAGLVKEWAYAGAFFVYTGAIVSHLTTGYERGEVIVLLMFTALTIASWALRPPDRRACSDEVHGRS